MPQKRVNHFNEEWLHIEKYKPWLLRHETSVLHAHCIVCKYDIHLGSVRLGAIESHNKGKIHLSRQAESVFNTNIQLRVISEKLHFQSIRTRQVQRHRWNSPALLAWLLHPQMLC